MTDRLQRLFELGSRVAPGVPAPVARALAETAGGAVGLVGGQRRLMVERNLRRVLGRRLGPVERRVLVARTFASYGRYWADTLRLPGLNRDEVEAGISVGDISALDEAVASGTGPILALPHVGGWEWAGRWLDLVRGYEVTAVVERLEPPETFEWFLALRRSLGMHPIPVGPSAIGEITRAVRAGHVTCLLCDRDITGDGVEVVFFGERTTLPGGPALLALRTGAPLLPAACYYEGSRVTIRLDRPVPVERRGRLRDDMSRITQDLAWRLEDLIRAHPEQWHLMQPNWPSDYAALSQQSGGQQSGG